MGAYGSPELYPNKDQTPPKWEKHLTVCKKCGATYHKKMKKCPVCETKNHNKNGIKLFFLVLMLLMIMFELGRFLDNLNQYISTVLNDDYVTKQVPVQPEETEEEYKAKCVTVPYDDLARNPNNYIGEYAVFKGKAIQVQENGSEIALRVDVTKNKYGYWEDTVYVDYRRKDSNESRILEEDIITMYGKIKGIKTYTAVLGNSISIPHLEAKYIDIN